MAPGRGRRGTAPVQILLVLVVLVLLVVVVPRLRSGPAPSAGGPSDGPSDGPSAASTWELAYGPGPQRDYVVHPSRPRGSCHYRYREAKPLPDPACTPGALNPEVSQATIGRTICSSGYSPRVRPPRRITDREKADSARAYGYTGTFRTAEYDHLVPLGLGGDPNDDRNLWLEPNDVPGADTNANSKDDVEDRLHDAVCDGRVDLAAAQRAIATDWTTAPAAVGLP